ncbi:GntR family transcriptional regulator [Leucobacter insecticola]|uniref:GntR family transcriptional regulator n=1 Tax=Leucobacter insecticola TaxID=2714934 RepID=UPI0031383CEB
MSITEAIADDLRNRLLEGEFSPGAVFPETTVAEMYDVARPTARVAIERVVSEGLLERHPHRPARVPALGVEDVRDIYRSRIFVESEVLRSLAREGTVPAEAERANADIAATIAKGGSPLEIVEPDMRFHTSLVDAVGSARMSKIYESLANEVRACMLQVQGRNLLVSEHIHAEHALILQRIAENDPDGVAAVLDDHLTRARDRLSAVLAGGD